MDNNDNQVSPRKLKLQPLTSTVAAKISGVLRLPSFREGLLVVACFVLLITLLQINLFPQTLELQIGQPSKIDVYAPRDVVDPEATRMAREEALAHSLNLAKQDESYYLIDDSVGNVATFKLGRFFEEIDRHRTKYSRNKTLPTTSEQEAAKFQAYFKEKPRNDLLIKLITLPSAQYQEVKEKSYQILNDLQLNQRISEQNLANVRLKLTSLVSQSTSQPVRPTVNQILNLAVRPNLILDSHRIEKLKQQVSLEVPEVVHGQNELLIAKNQIVTDNDLKMLEQLHLFSNKSHRLMVFFSLAFFVLLLIGLALTYIFQFHPGLFREERLLYLLLILILLVVGLVKLFSLVNLAYLAPVSFVTILIAILINPRVSLVVGTMLSLLGGIIVEYSLALTIFYSVSGTVAVLALNNFQRQRDIVRCGWLLMASNAIIAIALNLLFRNSFNYQTVLLATANGLLSAVLAIGLLPFVEHTFRLTSPIRLLELANPSNPLLRRLQIEAPGTYHHSIMVGNLAEAAAEGINADALWVRVGSYYHDIGKIKRPYFFVENQFSQENPHEKLNPSLSTLIITYHVKEGAEIAKEHGLPTKLIEIIEQHHGTDLVRYFYRRAAESLQVEREALVEEDFRYEGPKPQSKEAALVMLADSVEAAVKSLSKPTPLKIETLIQKIIRERLDDGQFDECDLTLKDLNNVKNSFMKVLGGLFHNRIEYPENVLEEIEEKKDADSDQ